MMNELFDSPSHPFYKFGDLINLKCIPINEWVKFIVARFSETGKKISEEQAHKICEKVELNSSYVQNLSWNVWTICNSEVTDYDLDMGYDMLLDQNNVAFAKQIESLTSLQLNYIKALVAGVNTGLTRKEVIDRFNLGTSANVAAIQKVLQRKEIIYIENQSSFLCDPLMAPWFRRRFNNNGLDT